MEARALDRALGRRAKLASMYRDRLYTPDEARKILARAAKLADERARPDVSGGDTKTFAEIEAMASSLGIERALVERAAGASEDEGREAWKLFGSDSRLVVDRVLPFEIGAEDHLRVVQTIRERMRVPGRTEVIARSLTWSCEMTGGNQRSMSVTLVSEGDRTRVRVEEFLGGMKGGLFGGLMGGFGGGGTPAIVAAALAIVHSPAFAALGAVLWIVAVFFGVRALFEVMRKRRKREIEELAVVLEDRLAASRPSSPRLRVGSVEEELGRAQARLDAEAEAEAEGALEHEREAREAGFPPPARGR